MTPPPYPDFDGTQPCATTLPDAWFGQDKDDDRERVRFRPLVLELCEACPFTVDCRDYARQHELWGVWGGETRRQRQQWQRANGVTPIRLVLDPDELMETAA